MACCTNTYNLGCFDSCDTIQLPFKYTQDGNYKIEFETQFRFKKTLVGIIDEYIELDLSLFPENTTIFLKIYNVDGSRYTTVIDGISYDCFELKTEVIKSLDIPMGGNTPNIPNIDTACCEPKIYEMNGVDTKVLTYGQWAKFGKIPTIEVYYKEGSSYIIIPIQPQYDTMPQPTTITITIPGIPSDTWYIKLS